MSGASIGEADTVLVPTPPDADPVDRAAEVLSTVDTGQLLAVLYDNSPDEWFRRSHDRVGVDAERVRIVSVDGNVRSVADGGQVTVEPSHQFVTPIPEPTDLTNLGIAIGEHLAEWESGPERSVVLFDSVSALLQWVERDRAVQFLHILRDRIRRADAVGLFLVNRATHDEETVGMLEDLFDVTATGPSGATGDRVPDDPSPGTVLDLLSEPERRCVLRELVFDGEATVERLADRIDREFDASRREALVRLHHVDLPRLVNDGVVTYDRDAGHVELVVSTDRIRPYLAMLDADAA